MPLLVPFLAGGLLMTTLGFGSVIYLDETTESQPASPLEEFGSLLLSAALFVVAVAGAIWILRRKFI